MPTITVRGASTCPSRTCAWPRARPDKAARADETASSGVGTSGLAAGSTIGPVDLHTVIPAAARGRARPQGGPPGNEAAGVLSPDDENDTGELTGQWRPVIRSLGVPSRRSRRRPPVAAAWSTAAAGSGCGAAAEGEEERHESGDPVGDFVDPFQR